MTLPIVRFQPEARVGESLVEYFVSAKLEHGGMHSVYRPIPHSDVGIDGLIEVTDTVSGVEQFTGRLVAVQIKCGASYLRPRGDDHWIYYATDDEIRYWQSFCLPVLLVIVDPQLKLAYWCRADDRAHTPLESSVAVLIPRTSRLGVDALPLIRDIARTPERNATVVADSITVHRARHQVAQLTLEVGTNRTLADVAAARRELALLLATERRVRDAANEAIRASQEFQACAADDAGAEMLSVALEWVCQTVRDPSLGEMAELRANTTPEGTSRPGARIWDRELSAAVEHRLAIARAHLRLLRGDATDGLELLDALLAKGRTPPSDPDVLRLRSLLHSSIGSSQMAALACDEAAKVAGDEEGRQLLAIRAAFNRAQVSGTLMGADPSPVGSSARSRAAHLRARAWCALNAGQIEAAAELYDQAGTESAASGDSESAVRSFRNAGRAQFLGMRFSVGPDTPDAKAARLETQARVARADSLDVTALDDFASRAAAEKSWRSVFLRGTQLRVVGMLDYDVAAYRRGCSWLGVAWRAAARDGGDANALVEAIRWSAVSGSFRDDKVRQELVDIVSSRGAVLEADDWRQVVAALDARQGAGPSDLAVALGIWEAIASQAPVDLLEGAPLTALIDALSQDRNPHPTLDVHRLAVKVILALEGRLSGTIARAVLPLLTVAVRAAPPIWLDDGLAALIMCVHVGHPTGHDLEPVYRLTVEGLGGAVSHEFRRYAALASFIAPLASDGDRSTLLGLLRTAAQAGNWDAAGALWFADPTSVTVELADGILERIRSAVERTLSEVGGHSFSIGAGYPTAIAVLVAGRGSSPARETTVDVICRLLNETGHLRTIRATWFSMAARIALTTPGARSRLLPVLADAAKKGLDEDERVPSFDNHPLGAVRMNMETADNISELAVRCLALLSTSEDSSDSGSLISALIDASHAPFAATRALAARAMSGQIEAVPASRDFIGAVAADGQARSRLRELTHDESDRVRLAAFEALDSFEPSPT